MTYRGIYREGIVILEGEVDLRDGATVDVHLSPIRKSSKRKAAEKGGLRRSVKRPVPAKRASAKHPLPGFGAWKGRDDIGDTAKFVRDLRKRVGARGKRGA